MFDLKIKDIAGKIRITAALAAVFFLLTATSGCCHYDDKAAPERNNRYQRQEKTLQPSKNKRVRRKRAGDYSKIPGNYPANWQHSTIGR
jgi:hypothetical protein